MTAEQVKRDVLLAAQPTKEFVTVDQVAALALYPVLGCRRADHRRQPVDRRRLDRASELRDKARAQPTWPRTTRRRSTSRCRAAARTAPSPGACSITCSRTAGSTIEGISGTSAGAMNAVMLADGLARGGPEEAQKRLADFWRAVSLDGNLPDAAARSGRPPVLVPADRRYRRAGLVRRDVALLFALRPQSAQHQSAART